MKTEKIAVIAFLLLTALVSCKKENPTTPVNNDPEKELACSFCAGEVIEINPSTGLIDEAYAQQISFFNYGNVETTPFATTRTLSGFYGINEGMTIDFNMAALPLACVSNKITFVHARMVTNTNINPSIVNIKFPTTPLIITVPDSLNYYLSPYGYSVQHFFQPGYVNMDPFTGFTGVLDSMIITGPQSETVTVGANLFESELRSICIAHE
jgi:hypothetical protein